MTQGAEVKSVLPRRPESEADGDRTSNYHGHLFKWTDRELEGYARAAVLLNRKTQRKEKK